MRVLRAVRQRDWRWTKRIDRDGNFLFGARATFERVDLGPLIEQLASSWETRREKGDARIAFARPRKDTAAVMVLAC